MMMCEMPANGGGPGKPPHKGGTGPKKRPVDQHHSLKIALKSGAGDASGLPEGIQSTPDGYYGCIICNHVGLTSLNGVNGHCDGDRHKTMLLLEKK